MLLSHQNQGEHLSINKDCEFGDTNCPLLWSWCKLKRITPSDLPQHPNVHLTATTLLRWDRRRPLPLPVITPTFSVLGTASFTCFFLVLSALWLTFLSSCPPEYKPPRGHTLLIVAFGAPLFYMHDDRAVYGELSGNQELFFLLVLAAVAGVVFCWALDW